MKSLSLTSKNRFLPIAAIVVLLTSVCGRSLAAPDETVVAQAVRDHGEASATRTGAPVKLPPLDPEVLALVETNREGMVEHRINTVSHANLNPTQKAQALFVMFKGLNTPDQRKVALAAVKFTDDTAYPLIHDQLLDATLDRQVLSVLMTHTLKRKNTIKLPVLLELAKIDGHPLQKESQDLLRAFLQTDHGTNWSKWEQTMAGFLAKNPS